VDAPRATDAPKDTAKPAPACDARAEVAELFELHGEAVYGHCARMMRDRSIAEDLMQQVFLEAHRDFHQFRGEAKRRTWLFGIATNRCLDELRRRRRAEARTNADRTEEATMEAAKPEQETSLAAFEGMDRSQLIAALEECVAVLPLETRATVLLRFRTDLTYEKMAEHLGAQPDTLQMRVSRAMPLLRKCLERKGWGK
jgi:RNA polymerase sigma factor (sigma-70 family)